MFVSQGLQLSDSPSYSIWSLPLLLTPNAGVASPPGAEYVRKTHTTTDVHPVNPIMQRAGGGGRTAERRKTRYTPTPQFTLTQSLAH